MQVCRNSVPIAVFYLLSLVAKGFHWVEGSGGGRDSIPMRLAILPHVVHRYILALHESKKLVIVLLEKIEDSGLKCQGKTLILVIFRFGLYWYDYIYIYMRL